MPIREYICHYDHSFEVFEHRSSNLEQSRCPVCDNDQLTLLPSRFSSRLTAIHPSERPIVFRNPRTGEIRTPATRDQPMHPKYAAQGFVREEAFSTFQERNEYEKRNGRIHEPSHYDKGSATAERDLAGPDPMKTAQEKLASMPKQHPTV